MKGPRSHGARGVEAAWGVEPPPAARQSVWPRGLACNERSFISTVARHYLRPRRGAWNGRVLVRGLSSGSSETPGIGSG